MNTKKYLRLLKYSVDCGDIPNELYERTVRKIQENGKLDFRIYNEYLRELEARRLFKADGAPFDTKNSAKTDGTYVYLHKKNPFWYIGHAVISTVFKFVGWLGSGLVYGMWRFPKKYKKNFKGVRACITVSNHVGYIDSCLVRRALGCRKQYIIAAPHNCKNNFGGALLRAATVVPLPSSVRGTRPFNDALDYYIKKNASLHFYAEKSMWLRYEKPRPLMEGAFYYADRLDVPVVPMLICFLKPHGLRKVLGLPRAVIKTSEPLYADKSLSKAERKTDLARRVSDAMNAMYEEHYGKPMRYIDSAAENAQGGGEEKKDENA